jgi:enoyl-CoA hydratase/carnithine racemase
MTCSMWRELSAVFADLGKDTETHGIILTGAEGNFCAARTRVS